MAVIVSNTGIGANIFNTASKWVGQVRGGLAMASIIGCGAFAAMCGSSMVCAVTMGKIAYPEMKRYNYDDRLSAGCIAAGGTMGILIPPSVGFIIYGLLTEQSISHLFIAGIIPGILMVIFYMITIAIICQVRPQWGPPATRSTFMEKIISLKDTWPVVVLFILVIGGIYMGIFTPTEAAAIGAFGAIIISFIARKLNLATLGNSMIETARTTAMVVLMIIGAFIFMRFITISNLPTLLSNIITALNISGFTLIAGIVVFYIFLGCFLEVIPAMILTLPIIFPTVVTSGFDPVWFGVVIVRLLEVGMVTPPIGLNCFTIAAVLNVPLLSIFRGIFPFVLADIVHIGLLIAFPQLTLLLLK
jgi:tripartite ATP-independent transporter DctM subunit